jgi:hypothetical protein
MSDFPEMEYASGDGELFELAPGETSLSLLQKIYRSSSPNQSLDECVLQWLRYSMSIQS